MGRGETAPNGWLCDLYDERGKVGQVRIVRHDGELLIGDDGSHYTRRALVAGAGVVEVETPEGR